MDKFIAGLVATFGVLLIVALLIIVLGALFALSWNWFLVPIFGLKALTVWNGIAATSLFTIVGQSFRTQVQVKS